MSVLFPFVRCAQFHRSWLCVVATWPARRACGPATWLWRQASAPATGRGCVASAPARLRALGGWRPFCKRRGDARVKCSRLLPGQSRVRRRAALQLLVYNCDLYVKALRPGVSIPALRCCALLSKSKLSESRPRTQPAASHCAAQLQPTHASTCSLDPCDQDEALQDKLKIEISVR